MSSSFAIGIPATLTIDETRALISSLQDVWVAQTSQDIGELFADLEVLKRWFDPVASGARLRRELAIAPILPSVPFLKEPLVYPLGVGHGLITPEGRVALEILTRSLARTSTDQAKHLSIAPSVSDQCVTSLLVVYRSWNRQRIEGVSSLLSSETSTLRPGATGLLLVLLINRNTAPERALPRPRDRKARATIEEVLRVPALAWGTTFTGRVASGSGIDLYRGWAIGELSRRFGPHLHLGWEDGVYIVPEGVELATQRIEEDLRNRSARDRSRIPTAWSATLAAYDDCRPRLARLGVAFERPSVTKELGARILALSPGGSRITTGQVDGLIE